MRVVVCCKAIPVDIDPRRVSVAGDEIVVHSQGLFINEVDEYALEAALALKEAYSAETWAMTFGPLRANECLYIAMAKSIDRVLRIDGDSVRPEMIAHALINALREVSPDLVITGVQSLDWMGGEVGVFVAEGLGMSLGYAVTEILEASDGYVRIVRELGGGQKAELRLKLPAVLCVQSGIQTLQYVSAMRRKKVRENPIQSRSMDSAEKLPGGVISMGGYKFVDISAPEARTQAEMITGNEREKILRFLDIIEKNI